MEYRSAPKPSFKKQKNVNRVSQEDNLDTYA